MIAGGNYAPIYGCNERGETVELLRYTSEPDPRQEIQEQIDRLVAQGKMDTEEYWRLIEQLEGDR